MSITDMFRRSGSRPGRTGISSAPTRKLTWDERSHAGAFAEESIGPLGVLFCVLLVAAAVFVLDYGVLPPSYKEGSRPAASVYSRLDFRYNDPNELSRLREEAAEKAPRVYVDNPQWGDNMVKDLGALISVVELAQNPQDLRDRTANFPADSQLVEELYKAHQEMGERRKFLSTVLLGRIRSSLQVISGDESPGSPSGGIVTAAELEFERNKRGEHREIIRITPPPANKIAQNDPRKSSGRPQPVPVQRLRSVEMARDELQRLSWKESLPRDLEKQISSHLIARLVPSLTLDPLQTDERKDQAQEAVGVGLVAVKQGELILNKDKLKIPRADLEKLHAEHRAFKASLPIEVRIKHLLGLGAIVFGTLLIFLFVTGRSEPGVLRRRRALVMLALVTLAGLAISRALMLSGYSAVLTPFVFVGIVASLAFGQTVALLTLFSLCVLTTLAGVRWEAFPIESGIPALGLALMAGGIAAALPAQRLRDRWDLLKNGAIGGIVQAVLVAGMAFLGEGLNGPASETLASGAERFSLLSPRAGVPALMDALLALASGPLFGLFVLGSLPLIESLFGILTSIRLFELADMNRPALKRIQLEAPGTFAHTLQVRFLAEPASDAIGANTRLISAGVLYHDLGKVLKPEYFVENQMDAPERHRRLRPSVSALLITAHVKDGIELAHEYGLPRQIIDFIPEHHGTTLVSYFFHSAKQKAETEDPQGEAGGTEAVQEAFFRYPGPKPQSRETAVVMLADTVEAASRTLDNPSAARLSAFVHELIMDKMLDGQLDECNLTFADLSQIEESFVRVLVTRFHSRVRYPGQASDGSAGATEAGFDPKTTVVEALPVVGAAAARAGSDKDTTVVPPLGKPAPSSRREVLTETRFISRSGSEKKKFEN